MPSPLPASATLGALLRLVQQEESKAPHVQQPGADPSTPVREAVATPLETPIAPESPESARNISLQSEGGLTASGTQPAQLMPGGSKVGGIGGVPGGMEGYVPGGGEASLTPEPAQPQPTLTEYLARGKTAAQWYAETGRQSELDSIGAAASRGGIGNFDEFLKTGQPANPELAVNPETGQTYQAPKQPGQPNNATLEDYLRQGKTVEQWYAETGRQSDLDRLTQGATLPTPSNIEAEARQNMQAQDRGVMAPSPDMAARAQGQVLGTNQDSSQLRPELSSSSGMQAGPLIGPLLPNQLRTQLALTPEEQMAGSMVPMGGAPTPTPTPSPTPIPGSLQAKLDKAKTKEEVQAAVDTWIQENPQVKAYLDAAERVKNQK